MQLSIKRAFNAPSVNCVFPCDTNYVPYLATALVSILRHISESRLYDIIVLTPDIGEGDQAKLVSLTRGRDNFSVRFLDVRALSEEAAKKVGGLFTGEYWSAAVYNTFFAPSVFAEYDRIINLGSDIVALADVAEYFDSDLNGKSAGVMRDYTGIATLLSDPNGWWPKQLGMRDPLAYFNSGSMLMDLGRMREKGYEDRFFERLAEVKNPRYLDQDVMSHVMEGDVEYLDTAWNSMAWLDSLGKACRPGDLPDGLYREYRASVEAPKLLHYITFFKPWNLPHLPLADKFWDCAMETPYYDRMRQGALKKQYEELDALKKAVRPLLIPRIKRKMALNALLAKISSGQTRAMREGLVQEARNEYRALCRERYAPQSKLIRFLRDFLRL